MLHWSIKITNECFETVISQLAFSGSWGPENSNMQKLVGSFQEWNSTFKTGKKFSHEYKIFEKLKKIWTVRFFSENFEKEKFLNFVTKKKSFGEEKWFGELPLKLF